MKDSKSDIKQKLISQAKSFYLNLEAKLYEMGVTIIKDDEIEKYKPHIGKGNMGKVYKGKYQENIVAIKKIMLKEEYEDDLTLGEILNEIRSVQFIQNEFIPKFFGLWKRNGHYHLVFEFVSGQTLKDKYKDLDIKQKLEVIFQLSKILEIIHSKHLIHRDIKPSNVMIDDDFKIKLIDFGVSKIAQRTETFTGAQSGTTRYMAPEYFQIDKSNNNMTYHINSKIDIWSTGCLISEIFSGILPWINKVKNELILRKKLMEKIEFPIPEGSIDYIEIIDIIKKCLIINPEQRVSAEELMKLIKDKLDNL